MLHDEGGRPKLGLDRFLEIHHLQAGQAARRKLVFFFAQAQLFQAADEFGRVIDVRADVGVCVDRLADGHARERLAQVHFTALIRQLKRTHGPLCRVAQQVFGEAHQILVVPVRRVELHHRELGVVPHADAFVAETPVDLEHALEAADDQALQVQLRRDAQEHLLVQRVVVRDEGLGVGPAGNGVQHGRLDFHEAALGHEVAHGRQRLAARGKARARGLVHDQVDVALAVLQLLVLHAVELVGQRAQAFCQQADRRGVDRQLALAGAEHVALDGDDVAQVPVLEGFVDILAHVLGDVGLDAAGGILHGGEAGLAHHPFQHHAAGDAGGNLLASFQRFLGGSAVRLVQLVGAVLRLEVVGEGHAGAFADGLELVAPLGDQLVFVLGQVVGGRGLGHGESQVAERNIARARSPIIGTLTRNPRF